MAIFIKDENNVRSSHIKLNIVPYERTPDSPVSVIGGNSFYEGCAVVLNNEIYVLGGGSGTNSASGKRFYKYSNGEWEWIRQLPYNFHNGAAVVFNNEIHIMGGYYSSGSSYSSYYYHYKYSNGEWVEVGEIPSRGECTAVVFHDEIHLFVDEGANGCHYKYSIADGWTPNPISTIPYRIQGCRAVVLNDEIHILGGRLASGGGGAIEHRKFVNGEWVRVSTLPKAFWKSSAVVFNNEIHIIWGDEGSTYDGYHYKYSNGSWVNADSNFPYDAYGSSAVVLNDELHVLGWRDNDTSIITYNHYIVDVLYYQTVLWSQESEAPQNFYDGSAVVVNGELNILGISKSPQNIKGHYKYSNNEWTFVSSLPSFWELHSTCAIVLNNEIHLLGPYSYHYKYSNGEWVPVSTIPFTFFHGCAVVLNNEIHLLGPYTNHYKYSNGQWQEVSTLPYDFIYGKAVVLNGEIHIFGGDNAQYSRNHYKYSYGQWQEVSILPYELSTQGDGAVIVMDNEINLLGGGNVYDDSRNHCVFYNGSWIYAGILPYPFWGNAVAILNGDMNILGGNYWALDDHRHFKTNQELCSHLFNKIKNIWAKVPVPTYDQYGNCTMVEQAKKVKAVWAKGSDNQPKRIYF